MPSQTTPPDELCALAASIIEKHFSTGLTNVCAPAFLAKRYDEFLRRDDPIYVRLLQGMGDEALSKTFVSYWTVAQTLATQSRFWLEDAVAEIITAQVRHFGRKSTHVYSYRMLGNGDWERQVSVADLGEKHAEHWSDRRPWRPLMKENALREVDLLVGEQERERAQRKKHEAPTRRRRWDAQEGRQASAVDQEQLERIARAVGGRAIADVAIQCNLLVVEPDPNDSKPHVAAFRFVNPKTICSHAQRKQERVNLLRLYAHLVQEKPFRQPANVHVCVAELLPRLGSSFEHADHYPDYFSPLTYWHCDELWRFIGVPFDVVPRAITNVAQQFREQLKDGLTYLLPGSHPPPGWGTDKRTNLHRPTAVSDGQPTLGYKAFDSVPDALNYTVKTLIANGHGFIVNVLGPDEAAGGRAATVQVVAQHMIFGDGNAGLAVHLPFDPSCGLFSHLVEFMAVDEREVFTEYNFNGIPCFVATFGTNVAAADKAISQVLAKVFGYEPSKTVACTVHDEGRLGQSGKWRAPPGGWGPRGKGTDKSSLDRR